MTTRKEYGIAYTDDGAPPTTAAKIVGWKQKGCTRQAPMTGTSVMTWSDRGDALEACDLDGWRGYVCEYPSGAWQVKEGS